MTPPSRNPTTSSDKRDMGKQQAKKACSISVVMASFLGRYTGAASDRETKFHRAVDSFFSQTFTNAELVIVADGCKLTERIAPEHERISVYSIPKQPLWSPVVRSTGIHYANGGLICYLDTDDVIGPTHLQTIADQAHLVSTWGYFNDFVWSRGKWAERQVDVSKRFRCGTSNIVHRANLYWPDHANDYAHDWTLIKSLQALDKGVQLSTPDYRVCHIPNRYDV